MAQELAVKAAGMGMGEALGIIDVEMLGRALEGLALVSQGQARDGMRLLDEAVATAVGGKRPTSRQSV